MEICSGTVLIVSCFFLPLSFSPWFYFAALDLSIQHKTTTDKYMKMYSLLLLHHI